VRKEFGELGALHGIARECIGQPSAGRSNDAVLQGQLHAVLEPVGARRAVQDVHAPRIDDEDAGARPGSGVNHRVDVRILEAVTNNHKPRARLAGQPLKFVAIPGQQRHCIDVGCPVSTHDQQR
jgi:hypothetical protein